MVAFAFTINILGLLFVPLSPLTIISILLLYKKLDYEKMISKKKLFVRAIITIVIVLICIMIARKLPYSSYYSDIVRRFCESVGVISMYYITTFIIKP